MLSSTVQAIMTYESLDPKRLLSSFSDSSTAAATDAFEAGDIVVTFGWPYYARCVSILLVCCVALPLIISRLCSRKSLVLLMATKNLRIDDSSDNDHGARAGDNPAGQTRRGSFDPPPSASHSSTSPRSNSSMVSSLVAGDRIEQFRVDCCQNESFADGSSCAQFALCNDNNRPLTGRQLEHYRAVICYEADLAGMNDCTGRPFTSTLGACDCSEDAQPGSRKRISNEAGGHNLRLTIAEGQKVGQVLSGIGQLRTEDTRQVNSRGQPEFTQPESFTTAKLTRKQATTSSSTPVNSGVKVDWGQTVVAGFKSAQVYDTHEMINIEANDITLVIE